MDIQTRGIPGLQEGLIQLCRHFDPVRNKFLDAKGLCPEEHVVGGIDFQRIAARDGGKSDIHAAFERALFIEVLPECL